MSVHDTSVMSESGTREELLALSKKSNRYRTQTMKQAFYRSYIFSFSDAHFSHQNV